MLIYLPYGERKLAVNLPDALDVSTIEPVFTPAVPDPSKAIRESLQFPIHSPALAELVQPSDTVGIIFSDITRPTPNWLILPEILAGLSYVPKENILLFNALGTHRENSQSELRAMLGDWIVDNFRIVQNDAFDPATQGYLGKTSFGHEIWLNQELLECNLKILSGFIEPHFFAGFSGGAKAIMPGMAGLGTILGNHSAKMIAHPKATWGINEGNPIYEEINEIVDKVENLFLVNVTLNKDKHITGVFSGEVRSAHAAGCQSVRQNAMVPVQTPYDVVITTNSGFPLDLNLYQSVKGMSAAAKIVKKGGAILIAAECRDGIPDHGLYGSLLRSSATPADLLEGIMTSPEDRQDQWQAQIQALIQLKADVYVYSSLTDEQVHSSLLEPVRNIEECIKSLARKFGTGVKICILPEGPQTIPCLVEEV